MIAPAGPQSWGEQFVSQGVVAKRAQPIPAVRWRPRKDCARNLSNGRMSHRWPKLSPRLVATVRRRSSADGMVDVPTQMERRILLVQKTRVVILGAASSEFGAASDAFDVCGVVLAVVNFLFRDVRLSAVVPVKIGQSVFSHGIPLR